MDPGYFNKNMQKGFIGLFVFLVLFYGLVSTWFDRASTYRIEGEEVIALSDGRNCSRIKKYIFTHYVPWETQYDIEIVYQNANNPRRIANNTDFKKYGFEIEILYEESYGDSLYSQRKYEYKKPLNYDETSFHLDIRLKPLTKLTVTYTLDWTEDLTEIFTFYPLIQHVENPRIIRYLPNYAFPLDIIIPIILFFISGYLMLPRIFDYHSSLIKDSYNYICYYNQNSKHTKNRTLEIELDTFIDASNSMTSGVGVFITPSVTILKMLFRSRVLQHKFTGSTGADEKLFEAYLENKYSSPASLLLEFKTLALIVGFLVSLGVSFTWNIGVISPIIFSLGLMIICINLGFALFIVDQTKSWWYILFLMVFILFVLLLEQEIWRRLSTILLLNF